MNQPPSPYGQGKGKVCVITYPSGLEYLEATLKYAEVVGPSRVEPAFEKAFIARYKPLPGIQVWCPDNFTTYIAQVPKMVCLF